MSASTKLRNDILASGVALTDIARRAGIALTTLHTFVAKEGAEMRASNFEKVAAALASLKNPRRRSGRRGVGEDAAAFDNGEEITMKVRITADQARVLRGSGMDIEALAQAGAEKALKEAEVRAWKEANHEALEASNRWIEKHGTLAEQLGLI